MADGPICGKCGGPRTQMKTAKGAYFLGCEKCYKPGQSMKEKKARKAGGVSYFEQKRDPAKKAEALATKKEERKPAASEKPKRWIDEYL